MADTLGTLLKNLANIEGAETNSEAIASTNAYIPGYPALDMTETVDSTSETRETDSEGSAAKFSGQDMSLGAKKALANFTFQRLIEGSTSNKYPGLTQDGEIGHSREDALRKSPADNANFYEPGYLASSGKTNYRPTEGTLTELIDDKRVRENRFNLGSMLKSLNVDGPTTFGTKQSSIEIGLSNDEDIPKATFNLLKGNKFNPSAATPFLSQPGERGDDQIAKGMYSLYTGLLGSSKNSDGGYPKSVTVTDLRKAALEILHRAQSVPSGDAKEVADAIHKSNSPFTGAGDWLALTAHSTQHGGGTVPGGVNSLRIRATKTMEGFSDLEASGHDDLIAIDSYKSEMGGGGSPSPGTKSIARNGKSYGTMNSPSEPFNGVAPFGMIMPVIYAIVILGLAGIVLGAIMTGFGSASKKFKGIAAENPSSLAFGLNASRGAGGGAGVEIAEKFMNMFGVPSDGGLEAFSLFRGIMLFFGIDINPFQPGANVADAFINLLMGPGYYLVISKKVLADFEQITKAFDNFSNVSGLFNAITITLAAIEAFMSSFTIRYFILMNQLGRIDEDGRVRRGAKAHGQSVMSVRDERGAKLQITPSGRNMMSRWYPSDGSDPLSPLSARLFHASFLAGEHLNAGAASAHPSALVGPNQTITPMTPEARRMIEEEINSEYMPFSVQDLRTGEIISLPAFIQSVTDDFNAEYSATTAFGRTDPVQIYKGTKRNIGLTFHVVAMNPDDHDYIWYVINRFVTMVYPQRDAGRKRFSPAGEDSIEFTQPFSQTITASPVIRIRLGDLLASNASRSGFEKIFGSPKVVKGGATSETLTDADAIAERRKIDLGASALKKYAKLWHNVNKGACRALWTDPSKGSDPLLTKLYFQKGCPAYVKNGKRIFVFTLQYGITLSSPTAETEPPDGEGSETVNVWKYDASEYVADEIDAMALGGTPLLAAFRKSQEFPLPPPPFGPAPKVEIFFPAKQSKQFVRPGDFGEVGPCKAAIDEGKTYKDNLVAKATRKYKAAEDEPEAEEVENFKVKYEDELNALLAQIEAVGDELNDAIEGENIVTTFLDPKSNAITRAFDNAGGYGLAGVITSLNLNYNQHLWGVTQDMPGGPELGRRAPKAATITLSFAPIHDLPLGLDASGQMIAPSHPVGLLSREKMDKQFLTVDERIQKDRLKARRGAGSLPETDNPGAIKLPF